MPNNYPPLKHGELKYYRTIHVDRCRVMNTAPVTYQQFRNRLMKGITLQEAIYTPCNTNMARYNMKPKKLKNRRFRFISLFK